MANLPFSKGGLGLRYILRHHPAAHLASWADAVAMVHARHPEVAATLSEI